MKSILRPDLGHFCSSYETEQNSIVLSVKFYIRINNKKIEPNLTLGTFKGEQTNLFPEGSQQYSAGNRIGLQVRIVLPLFHVKSMGEIGAGNIGNIFHSFSLRNRSLKLRNFSFRSPCSRSGANCPKSGSSPGTGL